MTRARPSWAVTARLAVAALLAASGSAAERLQAQEAPAAASARASYVGKTLTEALLDLTDRGLKIVFTSNVVRPELRVEAEPSATEPRRILDELLAPHRLTARDGPKGTIVVLPGPAPPAVGRSSIRGTVLSSRDSSPLPGARVRIVESRLEALSDEDGNFAFVDPGPGPWTLEAQAPGFLAQRFGQLVVAEGRHLSLAMLLEPTPVIEEELIVTPSRISLLREQPTAPLGLSREEILALPHLGDDFYRAITLLPGTAGNDVSAQFHVRGGRRDETRILIDGQELYDGFHLKDFDSALSFVAAATLGSADLTTGGFPVEHGDRMSGVLDMTTVNPTHGARFGLGIGILGSHAGTTGSYDDGRGAWVAQVRRGSIDLVGRLLGDEDPDYWDAFAKLDHRLGTRNSLRGNLLLSGDRLDFQEAIGGESKRLETAYDSGYVWLTQQTILGSDLFFETAGSIARIDRDRRGLELEEDAQFNILDERDTDVVGIRQNWSLQLTPRNGLSWGWHLRRFETDYDYFGIRSFDNPLARIRHDFGQGETIFRGVFEEDQDSVWIADRLRPIEPLTLELGLRYDRHSQTRESHLSPRLNLAYALGRATVVRVAWGRFLQSQRTYELQVEDGETAFSPVERSEHRVLGFERLFGAGPAKAGVTLRIELYQREVDNPRPRYENLFEPINTFPEVEPDRVRIAPDRSLAEGVELFLRGRIGRRLGWWLNYSWASTEDRLEGTWAPRIFDQTHTLNLDLDFRVSEAWRVNLAWRYHSGWPTTPVGLEEVVDEEGEIEYLPVLGPINSERLPSYHRLDLRASRRWQFKSVAIDLFFDVQNLYDRANVAGFDIEVDEDEGLLMVAAEEWAGFLPSAGISVEF